MNHARNKSIIRARLADGASMTGVALNQPGPEGAEGLFDTMIEMIKAGELIKAGDTYSLPEGGHVSWEGGDAIPTDEIATACRGRPNMIVSIGYTGLKTCYLNVNVEDAIERYRTVNGLKDLVGLDCDVISFHDMFDAPEISI